jgi:predicted permease
MATTSNASRPFSERLFRCFLRLFPAEFREHFAGEMETVFRDQHRDAREAGAVTHVRFWWDTYRGIIVTAFREHQEILFQDVDYALRMMRKELAFTIVVIAILGLAIGASTAAFTAANAILIQPLPFSDGNHLMHLMQRQPAVGVDDMAFSVKEIEDYRSQNHTLDAVVEFHAMTFSLLGGREAERVDTGVVSANFFQILGVSPLYGRTFLEEDERPSATPVLILSYNFWKRSFGGDPGVVGQKYSMNDKQHVVIGVLPPIPQFPSEVDVYMPTSACPTRSGEHALNERNWHMMEVFATLKPGVSLAQAQADVSQIADGLRTKYPDDYPASKGYAVNLAPVHRELTREIRPVLAVLAAATGLLLLLACSNVAGIMLARMLARTRELTVRTILGASRARIIRSFVTEGVVLAAFGGLVGFGLAFWSLDILVNFASRFTSLSSQLQITAQVIAFCVVLSVACGVVVGLAPALAIRHTAVFATEGWGYANLPGRVSRRARSILLVAQLALSVVLLVGAGLTLRSLLRLEHIDAGFKPSGVLTARIYVLNSKHPAFFNDLLGRARKLPGVQSAALASTFPLYVRDTEGSALVEIRDTQVADRAPVNGRVVTPDYFRTIGIRLDAGREFTEHDDGKPTPVVIINQHMAKHYWPNQSPLGKQISLSRDEWVTVVGVVGDVRQQGLDKEPVDEVYGTLAEAHRNAMSILLRSSQTSPELAQQVAWIVHDLDPDAVITDVQPMMQVRMNSLASRRTTAVFLSIFAVIALCITASGISGMMALSVGERRHEIGVRIAMGATATRVIGSMMWQALTLIAAGLGAGFGVAWLFSSSMSGVIFGVGPRDSVTFAASSALLLMVAAASSFVPLTRVAKLDPVVLLKAE